MSTVICVFGPSCSGKSTLAKALKQALGEDWTYIDRDKLIEKGLCTDLTANSLIDQKIETIKDRIIIDAQIPWREKREGESYFLVLPPLEILIQRDDRRTTVLNRSETQIHNAREYVIETHQTLDRIAKNIFTDCFDSSQLSVQEEVTKIQAFIRV